MADKGSLTPHPGGMLLWRCHTIPGPWYYSNNARYWASDQSRVISGTVSESGTPIADCMVLLYWRPTGMLIGKTSTAKDGTYTFAGLIGGSSEYVVVAQDKAGGTVYNEIIKSLLTPG